MSNLISKKFYCALYMFIASQCGKNFSSIYSAAIALSALRKHGWLIIEPIAFMCADIVNNMSREFAFQYLYRPRPMIHNFYDDCR